MSETINSDWFWLCCLLGFFVQFATPLPKAAKPQPRKKAAKRRKGGKAKRTAKPAPKTRPPVKAAAKREKTTYTPAQLAAIDQYFSRRDYPDWQKRENSWQGGGIPL